MSRTTTIFLILALLLSSTLSYAARPEPTFSKAISAAATTTAQPQNQGAVESGEVEESCEGVAEEECLMRRTLVAHLDYIYTQKKNP